MAAMHNWDQVEAVRLMSGRVAGKVADTVLFLASDEAKFITAHEIPPDRQALRSSEMASTRDWFETVGSPAPGQEATAQGVYLALVAGARGRGDDERQRQGVLELRFRPRVADLPAHAGPWPPR